LIVKYISLYKSFISTGLVIVLAGDHVVSDGWIGSGEGEVDYIHTYDRAVRLIQSRGSRRYMFE
jgi:hypothetical protein